MEIQHMSFQNISNLCFLYVHVSVLNSDWRIFDHVTTDTIPAPLPKEEQVHVRARANSVASILKYLLKCWFCLNSQLEKLLLMLYTTAKIKSYLFQ